MSRPQGYLDELKLPRILAHGVDIDLVPERSPLVGFPDTFEKFTDDFRRHQIGIPIRWVKKNGQPWFEIDDSAVHAIVEAYRLKKKKK